MQRAHPSFERLRRIQKAHPSFERGGLMKEKGVAVLVLAVVRNCCRLLAVIGVLSLSSIVLSLSSPSI